QRLAVLVDAVGGDGHLRPTLGVLDVHAPPQAGPPGRGPPVGAPEEFRALRVARLEDLDHARQAVRDVRAGDAAGVERPHRQLRARLADRLRGDDPHRVADLAHLAGRREDAVASLANARL